MDKISIAISGVCSSNHPVRSAWPLSQLAEKQGFNIVPVDSGERSLHLEVNYSPRLSPLNLRGISREDSFLLALEPRAVLPIQYKRFVRKKFSKVLVTSPFQRILKSDVYFDYGFLAEKSGQSAPLDLEKRSHAAALLNANKVSWVKGNGYGKRRSIIRKLSNQGLQFEIGGAGWGFSSMYELEIQFKSLVSCVLQLEAPDLFGYRRRLHPKSPLVNFHGEISDAMKFLESCKFSLVVENDPHYLSEKIFQALEAGCVPLYWGPSLENFNLPADIAIELKGIEANSVVYKLSQKNFVSHIRDRGREFLSNSITREYWSHRSGLERLFKKLRENWGRN